MLQRKKYVFPFIVGSISIGMLPSALAQAPTPALSSVFFSNLQQLNISVSHLLSKNSLSRYELTRLLNAVECQDCIVPTAQTRLQYDEPFWKNFLTLPWKDFRDIGYLSGNWQGTNYYYCVAKVGDDDSMRGYPLATSPICWGKFCGQRSVSRAEFFQTLSNLLLDRVKNDYTAPRGTIKKRLKQQKPESYEYRVFNSAELEVIEQKENQTSSPTSRTEFTTYLKYCMFNPAQCGFQTFDGLRAGVWPLSEVNVLLKAGIITTQDVHSFAKPILPQDALQQLQLLYQLHTKCEFNLDYDCDGIPNHEDNCPYTYNPSQNDLDGYGIGDVCDDDIDGDGVKNPVGLVDDSGNINYWLLKFYPSEDPTPLGEQHSNSSFFIDISSLTQASPAFVQFEIRGTETPRKVERDFWDLTKGSGSKVQHLYQDQGKFSVMAKITNQKNQTFLLRNDIFLGTTSDTAYTLAIKPLSIDSTAQTASFQPDFQWKFDAFERQNSAIGKPERVSSTKAFTTRLIPGKRNNITLKGYAWWKLVAIASTDILAPKGIFFAVTPTYSPLLKTLGNKISTTLQLHNLSLSQIRTIKRDFGDGTNFSDTKLLNSHTYTTDGQKVLIQRIILKDNQELISTSTLTVQDPQKVWNQAFNIRSQFTPQGADLKLQTQGLLPETFQSFSTFLNGTKIAQQENITNPEAVFTIKNRQGVIRVKNEAQIGTLSLVNEGIVFLSSASQTGEQLSILANQLFSGLKCDLDQDGIPDLYDEDIDGDGIKNLLGMVLYERADCKLIVGDTIDSGAYQQHFGVCSLDNCPLTPNTEQQDLNLNGIGDVCENTPLLCWNGEINEWESCKICPQDVGPCTAFCGNGSIEPAENCKNCPQDVPNCGEKTCGNGKIDKGEQCDNGNKNGKDWKCSLTCFLLTPDLPLCWNGKTDEWETCKNCPQDLKDLCIDDGKLSCWNGKIDPGETCLTCPADIPICDQDGDGCPDATDPCPTLPWINACCPEIPSICEGEDCPLVKPICNQCPCHFADYSNTLQKDDQVRARLRDQNLNIHYTYSPFTALSNWLSFE